MPVFDLFSKRQKRTRGETPDFFVYDSIPCALKVQIFHIMDDVTGYSEIYSRFAEEFYDTLASILRRERGVFKLAERARDSRDEVLKYFLDEENAEMALDVVEMSFLIIKTISESPSTFTNPPPRRFALDHCVKELNTRFREAGLGYEFVSGQIVRVDSSFIHSETMKPTLALLRDEKYKGAEQEFLSAHAHYRHGRYKECLVDCLKAFESVMKTIAEHRGWPHAVTDTASKLIDVMMDNNIIPRYMQVHFTSFATCLKSGVPTIRNKQAGHGQGTQPQHVPDYLASYVLHLTATNILMLMEADKALT